MIFVDGAPFSSCSSPSTGSEDLLALLDYPFLVSASDAFKAIPERKVSLSEESSNGRTRQTKQVYVFQREYATVDPALVELVGTDEATTCIGLVIRNQNTGMTSIAHMDSPNIVDMGLNQMLSSIIDNNSTTDLDVHLVGAFEDISPKIEEHSGSVSYLESGHSFPLCSKVIEALQKGRENFHIQTLCVLGHNTQLDLDGNNCPVFNGFWVETCSGRVRPASFDNSSRCPDEIVRRIRVTVSSGDAKWDGKLLETYDTQTDQFRIAPCSWSLRWKYIAFSLHQLSDSELLLTCSTSPSAEGPDFLDNERRIFDYLIQHPNWRETFPSDKPRVFKRSGDGGWIRC